MSEVGNRGRLKLYMVSMSYVLVPLVEMHFADKDDLNVFKINERSINVLFKPSDNSASTFSWLHVGRNSISYLVNYDDELVDILPLSESDCLNIVESVKSGTLKLICPVDREGNFNTNDLSGEMKERIINSIKQLYI